MDEKPSRQLDPLALAFLGAAIALLAGLLLYVFVFKAPEPTMPTQAPRTPGLVEELRGFVAGLGEKFGDKPAEKHATKAPPKRAAVSAAPATELEAGRTWLYVVVVEPPVWREITLTYRTQREGASIGVLTDFLHADGKMNFHLGTFAANHPSHENTRFPGFFMYAAYLKQPLTIGQQIDFGWHWQGKSAASVKRFEGKVTGLEDLQLPAGNLATARIDGTLSYLEDGKLRGRAQETFWYAPSVSQIVRIVREGRTPDEGSTRIVAELAEFR